MATSLTDHQASYVLDRLIKERRLLSADVHRYLSELKQEIIDLEHRILSLKGGSAPAAAASTAAAPAARGRKRRSGKRAARTRKAAAPASAKAPAKRGRKARPKVPDAQRKKSMKLQGQYLGLIRQIAESKREKFATMAREKGRETAIKEMRAALGR